MAVDTARVNPYLIDYIAQAGAIIAKAAPGVSLQVVSGYRSPARQALLRDQWFSGRRSGLSSEPARDSKHTQGRAVDVGFLYQGKPVPIAQVPREYWNYLASLLEPVGVRWGGRFRSPSLPHFEI